MPQAFVTGATGFLGRNLVEQLSQQGWQITVLHRPTSNTTGLDGYAVELVEGSLLDLESLKRALPLSVDAVFHVAGNTSVWAKNNAAQTRDNVEGTNNMVAAALANNAKRFVHVSTWNVYGLEQYDVMNEQSPQLGLDSWVNYNRTKSLAEQAVKAAVERGLKAVIVNPSHIVGRYDPGNWSRFIHLVNANKLPGVPPGFGSFCHAEQVAKALIAAAEKGQIGHNYLLGGADASFLDVVTIIGELTGRKVPKRPLPAVVIKVVGHLQAIAANITGKEPDLTPEAAEMVSAKVRIVSDKAEKELGYQPVPLQHMLDDCYQWMKAEGLLTND